MSGGTDGACAFHRKLSENALVVHLNEHGMALHVECLGKAVPIAQCLERTIFDILSDHYIGERLKRTIKLA